MSVSAIGSGSASAIAVIQQQASSAAVRPVGGERENDGDKDDGATAVKTPSSSVNLNGQTVGNMINVTA